jgi:lipopolysaccharide biosynthesis protein
VGIPDYVFFVKAWRTGLHGRKPFPGFNPAVYRSKIGLPLRKDPTLEFISAGMPRGPWLRDVVPFEENISRKSDLTAAIHIHCFYPDLLESIASGLKGNESSPEVFLTFPSGVDRELLISHFKGYHGGLTLIPLNENIGRDIFPFLKLLPERFFTDFEVVGHLHTKKSIGLDDPNVGQAWFEFCIANLLGSARRQGVMDSVLMAFQRDSRLGMVFPDDPNVMGWNANFDVATKLFPKLGFAENEKFDFPIGTMFFCRPDSIKQALDIDWSKASLPAEPLPYDGTVLHALERVFGLLPEINGFTTSVTHVERTFR